MTTRDELSTVEVPSFNTWKLAFKLCRADVPGYLISHIGFWVFYAFPLVFGGLAYKVMERISEGRPASEIAWPVLALIVVAWVRGIAFWFTLVRWMRTWVNFGGLVVTNLMRRVVRGPGRARIPASPGEAVSRFRDDSNEYILLLDSVIDVAGSGIFAAVAIFILARIDAMVTLVCLIPLVGTLTIVHFAAPLIRRYRKESRAATSAVTGFIGEATSAVLAVKTSGAEDDVVAKFASLGDVRRRAAVKDRLVVELIDAANANLVSIAVGLILLLAVNKMRAGDFTVADFTIFVAYLERLVGFPRWLGHLSARAKHSVVSMTRLARMLNGERADAVVEHNPTYMKGELPDVPQPEMSDADRLRTLEVAGLSSVHPSGRGVRDINLTVGAGEFIVVAGKVGSGKTTLMRALIGLDEASGEVRWNGVPVADPLEWFVPPRCAWTPQVPRLVSDTLRDNILLGIQAPDEQVSKVLTTAVMTDDLSRFRDGLQTVVGPRGVRLSGGQIQRTATARMLARPAELLVFDDLSSALDVETEALLWSRLFASGSRTCLVVSHRRAALRRADRIYLLDDGYLVDSGRLDDLLGRSELMRELWGSEAGDDNAQPVRTDVNA